ncbi:hypothetical protein EA58_00415 [Photobacterium galatheae]|uniref:Uncharacterized protein n=1 Tax=Photobacterium galatheae TaxID=1654360 RepID=A0A066S1Q6_9GAMM|nr:hypothetical protein EA58_00415 [Photobacterium galatheae]
MPFGSLVLSGAVVGVPDADNLKIRPEFFPGMVKWFGSKLVFAPICVNSDNIQNHDALFFQYLS